MKDPVTLLLGDCLDILPTLDPDSIDAVVTDPPYELGFMGKGWDRSGIAFQTSAWEQALRVAKPGAHLLAFGGTRTYHRLACAIEDAGWEVRDCLVWGYSSGFPKSHNLDGEWQGWGTALKPAWEPILLARKPLRGTVAANVAEYGTGALNIDGCRIPTEGEEFRAPQSDPAKRGGVVGTDLGISGASTDDFQRAQRESIERTATLGRWPANLILTDPLFDGGVEGVVGGGPQKGGYGVRGKSSYIYGGGNGLTDATGEEVGYGDSGTYSRFFLIPKAPKKEREPLERGLVDKRLREGTYRNVQDARPHTSEDYVYDRAPRENHHPTVKPLDLMRHLVRLVTPLGGVVLDPFLGSGTTAVACEMEGFGCVGIEREQEYLDIAQARLVAMPRGLGL